VLGYTQSLTSAVVAPFPSSPAPAPSTPGLTFYWIDSDNETSYAVTYTANLSNNQTPVTATAFFHVARPDPFTFAGTSCSKTPVVNVGDVGQFGNGVLSLNFGYNPSPPDHMTDGITYTMSATTGYGGSFALVQLINVANSFTLASNGAVGNENTNGAAVLDLAPMQTIPQYSNVIKSFPAGVVTDPWQLADDPGEGLTSNYSAVTANETFQTYFMYQPMTPGAIWVTLAMINWNWAGTTSMVNGSWAQPSATSFSPSPANTTTSGMNTHALPQWSGNISQVAIH
jgi:hypothetical protein